MSVYDLPSGFAALFGHLVIWTYLFNAVHALPIPCQWVRATERFLIAAALAPVFFASAWWLLFGYDARFGASGALGGGLAAYAAVCWIATALAVTLWLIRRTHRQQACGLVSNDTRAVSIAPRRESTHAKTRWLVGLPGNEIFNLHIHHKLLQIPDLPEQLQGLTIAHLTDLHMTGRIDESFYAQVVEQTNALEADMIAITGDIVEKEACLPWLPRTLGQLRAPLGVYSVLGNHDKRMLDVPGLRARLADIGLTDVGLKTAAIEHQGSSIWIAGNEGPWFPIQAMDDGAGDEHDFRLALLHTPDQFPWAARHRFHLALAGHTHGGQIRFPLIGPTVCPSYYGLRYASGVFQSGETVLHVSRGVGALHPVRYNCPPELALLELTRRGG